MKILKSSAFKIIVFSLIFTSIFREIGTISIEYYRSTYQGWGHKSSVSRGLFMNKDCHFILDVNGNKTLLREGGGDTIFLKVTEIKTNVILSNFPLYKNFTAKMYLDCITANGELKGQLRTMAYYKIVGLCTSHNKNRILNDNLKKTMQNLVNDCWMQQDKNNSSYTSNSWGWPNQLTLYYNSGDGFGKKLIKTEFPSTIISAPDDRGEKWIDTIWIDDQLKEDSSTLVFNVIEYDFAKNQVTSKMFYKNWILGFEGQFFILDAKKGARQLYPKDSPELMQRYTLRKKGVWKRWNNQGELLWEYRVTGNEFY